MRGACVLVNLVNFAFLNPSNPFHHGIRLVPSFVNTRKDKCVVQNKRRSPSLDDGLLINAYHYWSVEG